MDPQLWLLKKIWYIVYYYSFSWQLSIHESLLFSQFNHRNGNVPLEQINSPTNIHTYKHTYIHTTLWPWLFSMKPHCEGHVFVDMLALSPSPVSNNCLATSPHCSPFHCQKSWHLWVHSTNINFRLLRCIHICLLSQFMQVLKAHPLESSLRLHTTSWTDCSPHLLWCSLRDLSLCIMWRAPSLPLHSNNNNNNWWRPFEVVIDGLVDAAV